MMTTDAPNTDNDSILAEIKDRTADLKSNLPAPWLVPFDELISKPAPVEWLVKRWLQARSLMMVHGPSGSGKTFVVLHWALSIASGMSEWMGHRIKPGPVVYLAGEGHTGLRGRVAAWRHHFEAEQLEFYASHSACDLNTPEGMELAQSSLKQLERPPALVVVDTLHRFLDGDENSAKDAKTMIDACNKLMSEFNCAVLLVHHTGVADTAKDRARGSSAWRGALDIEINVSSQGKTITIKQMKSKDAELTKPVYVELQRVEIPGWYDEDREQITSAVIVESEPKPSNKPLTPLQKIGMDSYEIAAKSKGVLDELEAFRGIHLEIWRPEFYKLSTADNQNSKRQQFNRVRKDLVDRGELVLSEDDEYMYLPKVGSELVSRLSISTLLSVTREG